MHLRLNRIADLTDEQLEEMVEGFESGRDPVGDITSMMGFRGFMACADREGGRFLVTSLWSTARDVEAGFQKAAEERAERFRSADLEEPIADAYEIVSETGEGLAGPTDLKGMAVRLHRAAGLDDARIQSMVESFEEEGAALEEIPGFAGCAFATNKNSGLLASVSVWHTSGDLAASQELSETLRARITVDGPGRAPLVDRYEVVAHVAAS